MNKYRNSVLDGFDKLIEGFRQSKDNSDELNIKHYTNLTEQSNRRKSRGKTDIVESLNISVEGLDKIPENGINITPLPKGFVEAGKRNYNALKDAEKHVVKESFESDFKEFMKSDSGKEAWKDWKDTMINNGHKAPFTIDEFKPSTICNDAFDKWKSEKHVTESVGEDSLEKDGYKYVGNVGDYHTYRKIENGKGKWKALHQHNTDAKPFDITYEQARGYEPIDNMDSLRRKLGKALLPPRGYNESLNETWADDKYDELMDKGEENWTDDDFDAYNYIQQLRFESGYYDED